MRLLFGSLVSFIYLCTIPIKKNQIKNESVKEFKLGTKKLSIYQDMNPEDPRNWDNLGLMVCSHKRYNLGDKHDFRFGDYGGWGEAKQALIKKYDAAIILPLYLYDHSGITMKTTPFSCPWDSGQVGFILISKAKIREEYSVKRITKELLDKVEKNLLCEVETYDQYLSGDVYGFTLVELSKCNEGHEHETEIDSCWGFYGHDFKDNGIAEQVSEEFAELLKTA